MLVEPSDRSPAPVPLGTEPPVETDGRAAQTRIATTPKVSHVDNPLQAAGAARGAADLCPPPP
jgi:hypothetical protein